MTVTDHKQALTSRNLLVDEGLVPLLEALWEAGFSTSFSCQGGRSLDGAHTFPTYIWFDAQQYYSLRRYFTRMGFRVEVGTLALTNDGNSMQCEKSLQDFPVGTVFLMYQPWNDCVVLNTTASLLPTFTALVRESSMRKPSNRSFLFKR